MNTYENLRPFFGWVNSDIVKQTIDQTTRPRFFSYEKTFEK